MRKLKIAYTPMGEDVPFTHKLLKSFNNIKSFLKKDFPKFLYAFNNAEGYGQLNSSEQDSFKKYWQEFQNHLRDVIEHMKQRPPNLTKKGFSFRGYLAKLFKAKMHFKHRQELLRWQALLKSFEAEILSHTTNYPSLKDPIVSSFAGANNKLDRMITLLRSKE